MDGWKEGRMDGWKEGQKDRREKGERRQEEWMDGWKMKSVVTNLNINN